MLTSFETLTSEIVYLIRNELTTEPDRIKLEFANPRLEMIKLDKNHLSDEMSLSLATHFKAKISVTGQKNDSPAEEIVPIKKKPYYPNYEQTRDPSDSNIDVEKHKTATNTTRKRNNDGGGCSLI